MPSPPDLPSPFDDLTLGDPFSDQVAPVAGDQVADMLAYTLRQRLIDTLRAWLREDYRPRIEAARASGYVIAEGGVFRESARVLRLMADQLERDADEDDGPASRSGG